METRDFQDATLREQLIKAIASTLIHLSNKLPSDPQAHLELIQHTARAKEEVDQLLQASVVSARTAGLSWEAIGKALDMSRQAAQQRFGGSETQTPQTQRLSPLTAHNEIEVLNRAGRYGWRSVGFGILYHDIEQTQQQWEHCRVTVFEGNHRALERQGWQRVGGMWFPYLYYARPLGLAPLPLPQGKPNFFSD